MSVIELTGDDARFISANAVTGGFFGLTAGELDAAIRRATSPDADADADHDPTAGPFRSSAEPSGSGAFKLT